MAVSSVSASVPVSVVPASSVVTTKGEAEKEVASSSTSDASKIVLIVFRYSSLKAV